MGLAYKENSSDTRNSPVFNIYKKLKEKSSIKTVDVYDPLINFKFYKKKINLISALKKKYDGILITVPHNQIVREFMKHKNKVCHKLTKILDVKYAFNKNKRMIPL